MIDQTTMMLIIALGIIVVMGVIIWKLLSNRPTNQAITKNQYERLNADFIASAKTNRIRGVRWIGITGDSYHPAIRKFIRYKGDEADARVLCLLTSSRIFSPKRWIIVPWDFVDNYGNGKTIWIRCNGITKMDYFFRPIICKEHILSKEGQVHTIEYYDNLINQFIELKINLQSFQDETEQIAFETLVSSSHRERPLADIMQKKDSPQVVQEDVVTDPEV